MSRRAFFKELFEEDDLYMIDQVAPIAAEQADNERAEPTSVPTSESVAPGPETTETNAVAEPAEDLIAPDKAVAWPVKGANNRKVLILVNESQADFINEQDYSLLVKILTAIKLQPDDTGIVNLANTSIASLDELAPYARYCIIFDETFTLVNAEMYAPATVDGITYLKSHPLGMISKEVNLKKSLWTALQTVFS